MPTEQEQAPIRLMQFITGHWVAAAIYSAAKLRLADHLKSGPRSSESLAAELSVHAPSLYRLMRSLAALGVLKESSPQHFALTEMGELLRSDHPGSMRPMALFQGAPAHWQGWGNFLHSVTTGTSAFEHVHGKPFFDYCQSDPEFSEAFNGAMTALSAAAADAVLEAYDFTGIRKLVDVGGGHGYLLTAILKRYPQLRGGIMDLPHVVAGAKPMLEAAGVSDRVELSGGSFFDSVPPADAYISKNIVHDWDDEHSIQLLKNMRQAMQGQGRVLLVEVVIGRNDKDLLATLIDLEMLHATHGGRERTEKEYGELFGKAGLKLSRVVETRSLFTVLEAVPG